MKSNHVLGSRKTIFAILALVATLSASAQCPQLYDYYGAPSSSPMWYSCSGSSYTLVIATPNSVGSYSVDWGDGSALQTGATLAPPQTVTHLYPTTVGQYTVTFTELATGCTVIGTLVMEESTSASIQIPVGGLTQVCAPQAVLFTNSSTNTSPTTVFTWDFGDNSPVLTMDHTNFGETISHTYMPGTVSCETMVMLTAENTCNTLQGGVSEATFNPIRIWDIDTAVVTPSATLLCWPDNEVTYQNNSLRNCINQGNIYQRYEYWNFGDHWGTGQDSIIDWTPWPPTFPHTIAYPAIGAYDVVLLDSNICGIDTARITINIVPPPTVSLSVSPDTICAGETFLFDQTTVGDANYYQWNFGAGGGFVPFPEGDQSYSYSTPGTYTIRYTASIQSASGCADTAAVTVVVLPSPIAAFTLDNTAACNSLTVQCTNNNTGSVDRLWDFGDGTTSTLLTPPPHTYATPGTYTITLTATNALNCSDQTSQDVTVYSPPVVQLSAQNVCEGATSSFSDNTQSQPGNEVTGWLWDFGDGTTSTDQQPHHLYVGSGSFTVSLTVTTPYCTSSGSISVTVETKPSADISANELLGCSPMNVVFANNSVGGTTSQWSFGDGSISSVWAPSHMYTNTGTQDSIYTARVVIGSGTGCFDTTAVSITVGPPIHVQFTHNAIPGCAPLDVTFTNQSTSATSYHWDFGDGTTSTQTSPSHQYVNTSYFLDVHTVWLMAQSDAGCRDSVSQQILVYPTPEFNFTALPDSGCSPLSVTFPAVVGAVSYFWDYGDGTTGSGPSPTHIYTNNSTNDLHVPVTLIGTSAFGCMDTTQSMVTVYPDPTAQFVVDTVANCHPFTGIITNQSIGANDFTWSYGDGTFSDTSASVHPHTWYNFNGNVPNTYALTLTVTTDHGCTSTAMQEISVSPAVVANFTVNGAGCAPLSAVFGNTSTGATAYQWNFGDGQSDTTSAPTHIYLAQGLNDVLNYATLIGYNAFGCSDSVSTPITIYPQPIAQFIPNTQAGCGPLSVQFDDISIGASNVFWHFGDGQELNAANGDQTHLYTNTSDTVVFYDPTLIATTQYGCTDTVSAQIQVFPSISAGFTVDTVVCSPFELNIVNTSIGADSYFWSMGDGTTSIDETPSHIFVNTTNQVQTRVVTLTATSNYGCTATTATVVDVHPVPQAAFLAAPGSQQFPNATVTFSNTSNSGPWTYAWNLGDGTTANTMIPGPHVYDTWGTYTITLVVSGEVCSDTATQQITIQPPLPTASFIGSGEGCAPLSVHFTNTSLQALNYQWQFGDGGTSTADEPTYTYNIPGTYTVTLTAFGLGGTTSVATKVDSVVVHPRATAFFVLQPEEVIVPNETVYFYNLSSNATNYSWEFGDGGISTEMNPQYNYLAGGTYDVQMIANNQWNCPDTFMVSGAVTGEVAGEMQFPNAFTPGPGGPTDGVYDPRSFDNRFFFPLHSGVEQYDLKIYDRWGELIFATQDIKIGWDGYYRGQLAKQDVYVWKAFARFSDGREAIMKGDLTLLR